ncbi:MAG TPA: flagellar biosynthetic protein FliO [Alphaproteobacteria bacterium]|nr:flagellar biosynthetic protein FliO [Alphaproteobacteria bacterium]
MEAGLVVRSLLALAAVIGLMLVAAWVVRRLHPGFAAPRARGARRRLSIVEVLPLDARRRLVLVRRDGTEHLLLLGPERDLLVEPGIAAPEPFALPSAETPS